MKNQNKIALITGITGQDGSYLAELLLEKNYQVFGLIRHENSKSAQNIQHIADRIEYVIGNLTDFKSLKTAIQSVKPSEIYNLAAQSKPAESWLTPLETSETTAIGAHHLFEAVYQSQHQCKIFHASSCEMYGNHKLSPQNEETSFNPISPYAVAKVYAHNMARIYRDRYGMFLTSGILFNHESPRRPYNYVMQKITYAAACIANGIQTSNLLNETGEPIVDNGILRLGNIEAQRDWGFAYDFVNAMWLTLQQPAADEYTIGTGVAHSIKDLCSVAFEHVGLNWTNHIEIDKKLLRPSDGKHYIADPSKAKKQLGWECTKSFDELVGLMVDNHIKLMN